MWILMALLTAVAWGMFYTCAGQVIKHVDKSIYLSIIGASNLLFWLGLFFVNQTKSKFSFDSIQNVKLWLLGAVVACICGNYLSLKAIEYKNATYASVVEISYPIFCALFGLILLGQNNLTLKSFLGMLLVLIGTVIFILGEKS